MLLQRFAQLASQSREVRLFGGIPSSRGFGCIAALEVGRIREPLFRCAACSRSPSHLTLPGRTTLNLAQQQAGCAAQQNWPPMSESGSSATERSKLNNRACRLCPKSRQTGRRCAKVRFVPMLLKKDFWGRSLSNIDSRSNATAQSRFKNPFCSGSIVSNPNSTASFWRLFQQHLPKADSCTAARQHLYSITSSARASSVGGTSRPSAFAAFRLITNSNLVDCTTGRSTGLAPLRIRPA